MRRIVVRNFGPIEQAEVELKRVNIIIGPQSAGKSCLLKVACYCTWVEKRIQIAQSADSLKQISQSPDSPKGCLHFCYLLEQFHRLKGYMRGDSYISYESDCMAFSYAQATGTFGFRWKDARWEYLRPRVSYIPAERNMVAAIPNWFEVKLPDDNIRSFLQDWDAARKSFPKVEVLNLGVSYRYDTSNGADKVVVDGAAELDFSNTSSGLQAVIPILVHLSHLTCIECGQSSPASIQKLDEDRQFLEKIPKEFDEERRSRVAESFTQPQRCEIFLEEPELSLFPPTQAQLVDWLLEHVAKEENSLSVATHSPYILTAFLEREEVDVALFTVDREGGQGAIVKTAGREDIQAIYDDGIDAFFNIAYFRKG
ncbi:MAG: hypothetical protein AL399_01185 [Candidatus [Bacteroides] periocalifornicus]|uniref:ATPase AAA-type core domain-containing protein n=1 Tax=Candidatus [Bacteroides] periocalifornicus TaxID=1702214 RepID=A0A0Q4BA65_9BACT|nr:MAG: hypothetical protein AL399_01185 [Candidatus [Bacteroides] periocalifornicus]